MRLLSFIFVIVVSVAGVSAQMNSARQSFDEATEEARNLQFETAIEDYQKAISFAEKVKNNDQMLAQIHSNIGICFYRLARYDSASQELKKAIELSKGRYHRAFYSLGMVQTELKKPNEAIWAFRKALKIKEDNGEAWFDLALVYLEQKDFNSAKIAFQNAISFKSVSAADAHNNLGVIFAIKSNFEAAENEFKIALQTSNGKSIEAANNLKFCENRQLATKELIANLNFVIKNSSEE